VPRHQKQPVTQLTVLGPAHSSQQATLVPQVMHGSALTPHLSRQEMFSMGFTLAALETMLSLPPATYTGRLGTSSAAGAAATILGIFMWGLLF
jgi:hypothetical protein